MQERVKIFHRAAETYDADAQAQRKMAHDLITLLPNGFKPQNIFECGCGTGYYTQLLSNKFPQSNIQVTDAAPQMLTLAEQRFNSHLSMNRRFAIWDANPEPTLNALQNDFAFPERSFDLATSNALIQWFTNPLIHLQLIARLLRPQGFYLVSDFQPDHFPELQHVMTELKLWNEPLIGHAQKSFIQTAELAGYTCIKYQECEKRVLYPSVADFLHSLKNLGTSRSVSEKQKLTKEKWKALQKDYTALFSENGKIHATWKPTYILLQKHE